MNVAECNKSEKRCHKSIGTGNILTVVFVLVAAILGEIPKYCYWY